MFDRQVSIIMAVHNGLPYLGAAIDSIRQQTLSEWQMIVVDDASTDGTAVLLATFAAADPRIRVFRNEIKQGLAASLNSCLDHANGDFIARMDADDVSLPGRLKAQVGAFLRQPDLVLLGTNVFHVDEDDRITGASDLPTADWDIRCYSLLANPFAHPSVMIRADTLARHRIRYDPTFDTTQDWDLWRQLMRRGSVANLRDHLVRRRAHSGTVTAAKGHRQQMNSLAIQERYAREFLGEEFSRIGSMERINNLVFGSLDETSRSGSGWMQPYKDILQTISVLRRAYPGRNLARYEKFVVRICLRAGTAGNIKRAVALVAWLGVRLPRGLLSNIGIVVSRLIAPVVPASGRPHLCFVIGSLDRGGTEMHLSQIAPRLLRSFDVSIILFHSAGDLAEAVEAQGVKIYRPWLPWLKARDRSNWLGRVARLAISAAHIGTIVAISRPKIINFLLPASYYMGGVISVGLGVSKGIMWRRSLNNYQKSVRPVFGRVERWLHHRMAAIIGNSQRVVDQLVFEEGAPAERTFLVHNGIEIAPAASAARRAEVRAILGIRDGTVVMVIVANLIPYKGHHDLIEACRRLQTKTPWKLLIVGGDSSGIQDVLNETVARWDLRDRIEFLGLRSDARDIMSGADIGILCSHEEGFSNAILECMAAGLPMVVTDVGGNREAVVDGESGFVVPARDPEAMADALRLLIDDPRLREKFGAAGAGRVRENFGLARCIARYERIFDGVLWDDGRTLGRLRELIETAEVGR